MLLVYAITLALTFVSRVTLPRGISFAIPAGWQVTTARINGVRDPVTVFTATSFRLRHRQPAPGLCSRTLQDQWRVDGAYVQLTEERDGASRRRMLPRTQGGRGTFDWMPRVPADCARPRKAASSPFASMDARSTSSTDLEGARRPRRTRRRCSCSTAFASSQRSGADRPHRHEPRPDQVEEPFARSAPAAVSVAVPTNRDSDAFRDEQGELLRAVVND